MAKASTTTKSYRRESYSWPQRLLAVILAACLAATTSMLASCTEAEPAAGAGIDAAAMAGAADSANVAATAQMTDAQVEIEVRNACGVDGAAAAASEQLAGRGFDAKVWNTQWPPLLHTWIVYRDSSVKDQAYRIGKALGVQPLEYFNIAEKPDAWQLTKDITVLVGLDWANANMLADGQDPYIYVPSDLNAPESE